MTTAPQPRATDVPDVDDVDDANDVHDEERVAETPDVVIGNHCHKYTAKNPVIRHLTNRWLDHLELMFARIAAEQPDARVLEIGCGEGEIAARLRRRFDDVTALDLPDAGLREDWTAVDGPKFLHADAEQLPFRDKSFDLVVSVEVLEHLVNPRRGLVEYARVARRHMVLSVPREPIFRMGNLFTGRHRSTWGNTPGHLNHWSTAGFTRFTGKAGRIREVQTPLPWTISWVEVDGRPITADW